MQEVNMIYKRKIKRIIMAGVINCCNHGRQRNIFVTNKLQEHIDNNEFTDAEEYILQIEGINVAFYSELETAINLGANGKVIISDLTIEEFESNEIINVLCKECLNDFLIKSDKT